MLIEGIHNLTQAACMDDASDNVVWLFPAAPQQEQAVSIPDEAAMLLIGRLRRLMLRSLLQPRHDLDHACMLIAATPSASAERYSAAFFHGLECFARRKLRFYTSKALKASDDEMWLTRLMGALQTGDGCSAQYLLASRVEARGRRRLLFLAQGLANALLAESAEDEFDTIQPERQSG